MRYIFIINPVAGKENTSAKLSRDINEFFTGKNETYKIYVSKYKLHICEIAKSECEKGDMLRIYVFGGDGSFSELVDAVKTFDNVEVGLFPYGSGNDFVKNFDKSLDFMSIEKQINGTSKAIDTIDSLNKTSANICSIGLDAGVGYNMIKFKRLPFVSGAMSYNLAVVKMLLTDFGANMKVKVHADGKITTYEDNYLFVLAANGICYGGGYYGAPLAKIDDGLLELILIKTPSRLKIMGLIGSYKKGNHLTDPKFKNYLTYVRGTKIEVESEKDIFCNFDGECLTLRKDVFSLGKNKIKFITPTK